MLNIFCLYWCSLDLSGFHLVLLAPTSLLPLENDFHFLALFGTVFVDFYQPKVALKFNLDVHDPFLLYSLLFLLVCSSVSLSSFTFVLDGAFFLSFRMARLFVFILACGPPVHSLTWKRSRLFVFLPPPPSPHHCVFLLFCSTPSIYFDLCCVELLPLAFLVATGVGWWWIIARNQIKLGKSKWFLQITPFDESECNPTTLYIFLKCWKYIQDENE